MCIERMTEKDSEKKPKLLPQFMGWMDDLQSIGDAGLKADRSKTHVEELNLEGDKTLRKLAYEYGKTPGEGDEGFNPALVPNPDALSPEEIKRYIGNRQSYDIRNATTMVRSSLDGLVAEMDDESVLNVAKDKDLIPLAGDDGRAWYSHYQASQGAHDLAKRAKDDSAALKKEEKEGLLRVRAAELREKKYDALLKKYNNDTHLASLGADAHVASFLAGHVEAEKDWLPAAAQKNADAFTEKLREYEKGEKYNARSYAGEVLKALAERDLNKTRDKIYSVAKK